MNSLSLKRHWLLVTVILILLFPYSFSFGDDEEVTLTVSNQTGRYIHVIMNGDPFLYVAPGRQAVLKTEGHVPTTINAQAFYAPGQGISGSATESFVIGGHVTEITGCGSGNTACSTEPANPSTSWTVTPDLMVDTPPANAPGMEESL